MRSDRIAEEHSDPEEVFEFIEGRLRRRQRRRLERHLDACVDCVEYLATVVRAQRLEASGRGEDTPESGQDPMQLYQKLRHEIIATSPGSSPRQRRGGSRWAWKQWVPAAAAVTLLLVAFGWVQKGVIAPARSRQLASKALAELTTLRQATGRLPLRYISGFRRARITRSGFDTGDPSERLIEQQLLQAVALAPAEPEAQTALGQFLLDRGQLEPAAERLERALELDPSSTKAANALAVVDYERALRDPPRAAQWLRQALELLRKARAKAPGDLQVAFNLAMVYQELGAKEAARLSWSAYLERDHDSEWAAVAREKLQELEGQ